MLLPERRINVQFSKLGASEHAALKKFIDEGLIAKTLIVDQNWNPSRPEEQRQFVRVSPDNFDVSVMGPNLKKALACPIVNVSLGGVCLALPSGAEIKAGQEISLHFGFLKPMIKIQGKVLELVLSSVADAII